jgi:hypothetical protein
MFAEATQETWADIIGKLSVPIISLAALVFAWFQSKWAHDERRSPMRNHLYQKQYAAYQRLMRTLRLHTKAYMQLHISKDKVNSKYKKLLHEVSNSQERLSTLAIFIPKEVIMKAYHAITFVLALEKLHEGAYAAHLADYLKAYMAAEGATRDAIGTDALSQEMSAMMATTIEAKE